MNNKLFNIIKNKYDDSDTKYILLLLPIGIISYLIKSYYFQPENPLTFDGLGYFFYAVDISILGHLPENYILANNFWSIFLVPFFSIFEFENTIQYMDLQKNLSMILSTVTIIPIYFLARKFFEPKYSIIGALIFALEPRLIQNSLLGIIEPLYILISTLTLVLFLSSNKKLIYLSFVFAGLTSLIRGEGQILFFVISIIFFIRFRNEKITILKYPILLGIFIMILAPMIIYQTEIQGHDSIFGRAAITISYHIQDPNETGGESGIPFFINGIENFSKFFVWDLIPTFIFFVPIGILYLFKKPDFKKLTLILWGFGISIPAYYAYSIPLPDTRYLFMLYPIFCIVSVFGIKKILCLLKRKNIVISVVVIGIFFSSLIFLEIKDTNDFQKYEMSQIAKEIVSKPKIINTFYPEDHYLEPAMYPEKWTDFKELFLMERIEGQSVRNSISQSVERISTEGYFSIEKYIDENPKLTHIYTDEKLDRPEVLKKVFLNENEYKFLIKEYDSKDEGYNYHVKIFRIIK